jgi:SAM-dependent methyltransferase
MYKQGVIFTNENDYHLLTNRKGETKILKKAPTKKRESLSHNRQKNYLIPDDQPIPFLIKLGLMNVLGKISPQKYDKFKQINRFLEMVEDVIGALSDKKNIQIVDFGCGKAYLTFALYYYLHEVKGMDATIVGIDLKEDVIAYCQNLAAELNYDKLQFRLGSIDNYEPAKEIDMVVALHACDIATDEAIAQALRWKATLILVAPCCQHELYTQIKYSPLNSLLRHGILKERVAALATDAVRIDILEKMGYGTQILEFIDSEHTPKNLLIRAVRGLSKVKQLQAHQRYQEFKALLNIHPALEKLIEEKK